MGGDENEIWPANSVDAGVNSKPWIRPWQHGDLPRLVASEALYSAETCTRRFLVGQRRLPAYYLNRLGRAEATGGWMCQVALDGDRLVALAECAWNPAGSEPPELAVMVADGWQRRGIGRRVLGDLVSRCRDAGMTVLRAEYLHGNEAVRALSASLAAEMGPDWSVEIIPGAGTRRVIIRTVGARLASVNPVPS